MTFAVGQLGARMQYAVPRILHGVGALDRLFTDITFTRDWCRLANWMPSRTVRSLAARGSSRRPAGILRERITEFSSFGLQYAIRSRLSHGAVDDLRSFRWAGKRFCELIVSSGLLAGDGIYVFNTAGLELMKEARKRGLFVVLEQTIAPKRMEDNLLREERERFPDWERQVSFATRQSLCYESRLLGDREEAEWAQADLVVSGSEFVRACLVKLGVPAGRCAVVPYGLDLPNRQPKRLFDSRLRVLTVGSVGLRKGAQYVFAAARQMSGTADFRVVGPIHLSQSAKESVPSNVRLCGAVPRSEVDTHYQWADVFLLPSLCEGSATATYEALGWGLPVVCTPNTGSVVRDGVEGFVVPVRDVQALVDRLGVLTNASLRRGVSEAALARAGEMSLSHYAGRLLSTISSASGQRLVNSATTRVSQ